MFRSSHDSIIKENMNDIMQITAFKAILARRINIRGCEDYKCEGNKATNCKNQQCVVYGFQCDLCDAGYVGYTRGHLHNRVKGHKQQSSAIAKHYKNMHGTMPQGLLKRFKVRKKCRNKFDCLVYEMLFIRALKPNLNVQSDSIRVKVFL